MSTELIRVEKHVSDDSDERLGAVLSSIGILQEDAQCLSETIIRVPYKCADLLFIEEYERL